MRHPLAQIQDLQQWRGRRERDLSIAECVKSQAESAQHIHRRLGSLIELWRELMPPSIVDRTVLAGLSRGILTVRVDSAATAFEVDRLLRGGAERELRSRCRATLNRVRTRVEPLDDDTPPPTARSGAAAKPASPRQRTTSRARPSARRRLSE